MRKGPLAALALLPLVLVLSGCRVGVTMWDSCSVPQGANRTGTDGTYVLVCNDGRWQPIMTNNEFIAILQDRSVTVAPVPQPPVQAPPTTTAPTTTAPTTTTTLDPCYPPVADVSGSAFVPLGC